MILHIGALLTVSTYVFLASTASTRSTQLVVEQVLPEELGSQIQAQDEIQQLIHRNQHPSAAAVPPKYNEEGQKKRPADTNLRGVEKSAPTN